MVLQMRGLVLQILLKWLDSEWCQYEEKVLGVCNKTIIPTLLLF